MGFIFDGKRGWIYFKKQIKEGESRWATSEHTTVLGPALVILQKRQWAIW